MSRLTDDFTDQKAQDFCNTIRSGKRVTYAAEQIGVSRATVYNWKKQHEDFAQAWNDATAYANERMEEVVYDMGLNGDLAAAMWWLRNNKPLVYAKETLIKMAILQSQLANGHGIELDQEGMPVSVPNGKNNLSNVNRRIVILPANHRDTPDPGPAQEAPGATPKLPRVTSLEEQEARAAALQRQQQPIPEPVPETPVVEPEIIPPEPQSSSVVRFAAHRQDDPRLRRWSALAS